MNTRLPGTFYTTRTVSEIKNNGIQSLDKKYYDRKKTGIFSKKGNMEVIIRKHNPNGSIGHKNVL